MYWSYAAQDVVNKANDLPTPRTTGAYIPATTSLSGKAPSQPFFCCSASQDTLWPLRTGNQSSPPTSTRPLFARADPITTPGTAPLRGDKTRWRYRVPPTPEAPPQQRHSHRPRRSTQARDQQQSHRRDPTRQNSNRPRRPTTSAAQQSTKKPTYGGGRDK